MGVVRYGSKKVGGGYTRPDRWHGRSPRGPESDWQMQVFFISVIISHSSVLLYFCVLLLALFLCIGVDFFIIMLVYDGFAWRVVSPYTYLTFFTKLMVYLLSGHMILSLLAVHTLYNRRLISTVVARLVAQGFMR